MCIASFSSSTQVPHTTQNAASGIRGAHLLQQQCPGVRRSQKRCCRRNALYVLHLVCGADSPIHPTEPPRDITVHEVAISHPLLHKHLPAPIHVMSMNVLLSSTAVPMCRLALEIGACHRGAGPFNLQVFQSFAASRIDHDLIEAGGAAAPDPPWVQRCRA